MSSLHVVPVSLTPLAWNLIKKSASAHVSLSYTLYPQTVGIDCLL